MVINNTSDYQIKNYVWAARESSYEIMGRGMELDEKRKGFLKDYQTKIVIIEEHRKRC
jgi:hypothetical protein